MAEFSLKDLDPMGKFLFIASMKVALRLDEGGYDKKKYLKWCSEIWDTMKMQESDGLEDILNDAMKNDVDMYVNRLVKNR